MKNLKIASGLLMALTIFTASCSDDRDHNPTALEPTSFVLNDAVYASNNIILQNTSNIELTWSQPDYGVPVVATYTIEMSTQPDFSDIPGIDDDGNAIMKSSVSTLAQETVVNTTVRCKEINDGILNNFGIESYEDFITVLYDNNGYIPVYLRATSKFNDKTIYSNTISIKTLPFYVEPVLFTQYYLIGALNGWGTSSANMNALLYPSSEKEYSYTTQWTGDANLKFWELDNWGDWGTAWSTPKDGDDSPSGNLVKDGSGAMVCPEPGSYYTYSIDMGTATYTWTKCDNQDPTKYDVVSLIGIGGDWNTDYEMEEVYPHNWCLQDFTFKSKTEFKFRANKAWDVNWGVAVNIGETPYGAGKPNGDNITAEAGTFDIYFNDITGEFAFVKQ